MSGRCFLYGCMPVDVLIYNSLSLLVVAVGCRSLDQGVLFFGAETAQRLR